METYGRGDRGRAEIFGALAMSDFSTCKYCGAKIVWINTAKGKIMPVDHPPQVFTPPTDSSRPVLVMVKSTDPSYEDFADDIYEAVRLTSESTETAFGYRSHFATCPSAKKARRK